MKKYKFQKYFMFDGKRYVVRADSEFELATKYANKIRDLEEGKVTSGGNITVKDWTYKAIEIYKTRQSDITRDKYVSRVNSCILQHIGNFPLKSIKPINCQELLNLQSGKSQRHINEVYQALNFIFSKAVDNQLIINNPAKNIIKPIGSKNHYRAITYQEEIYIKEIAKTDRKYYLYLLMLFCGCRPSEAAEVQGKDIITENKYPLLHIRGTKTHNADRVVPLPLELYEIIKDTKHNEYVACYSNGNKIKYENRYRVWQSMKRQINIRMGCKMYRNKLIPPFPVADDLVPYCLRHTYCTNLARYGVDIRMAQKLMGHADITPTANIYTNLDDNDVIDVAKKLNENYPGVA
ncbi:MAG: site-specific integrase [Peptostreptococcaceae bacterium]|nr:site-specific integrase [Peptostreptococcaceae bacterium]MDY5738653.1 site-specific integrase [Anaerovoracaceae bacterium]